jgi:predicted secreted Zn-dependent protease
MKSINKKHQKLFNKALKSLIAYNKCNDLRTIAEDTDNQKHANILDKKCEKYFDNYLEFCSELPKREVTKIEGSEFY